MVNDAFDNGTDILFLCETWLQAHELPATCSHFKECDLWSHLKSSMDPKESPHTGRPYGGIGFVCRHIDGLTFKSLTIEEDRIHGLEVFCKESLLFTVYGVYLPFFSGSSDQIALYADTLDRLQGILDACASPFFVVGDMNATLPKSHALGRRWHRQRPFNGHSLLLYDFTVDNDLAVLNHEYPQSLPFTYFKGDHKSHIDYIMCSDSARESVTGCAIWEPVDQLSDHLPVSATLSVHLSNSPLDQPDEALDAHLTATKFPRINWSQPSLRESYWNSLQRELDAVDPTPPPVSMNREAAAHATETLCTQLSDAMHNATKCVMEEQQSPTMPDGRRKRRWWNGNCRFARDRHRFWFFLWKSAGRPRAGHLYESHKLAKKQYRKACRMAAYQGMSALYRRLIALFECPNSKKFWNLISASRINHNLTGNEVTIGALRDFYQEKFAVRRQAPGGLMKRAAAAVEERRRIIEETDVPSNSLITEAEMVRIVRSLKSGKSAGGDGILAEHLKHGASPKLHGLLCDLINCCIRSGTVPKTFTEGILIPILKKAHLDPSVPKNYRPITLSPTFSKILEKFLLLKCKGYRFSEAQFGFVEGVGTDIAATLYHDVVSHCNYRGSAVYTCSLDAEGAFDFIPHEMLFFKCMDIVPGHLWLTLLNWYSKLSVCIKWHGKLSTAVMVKQGTRQGGLSSPFLFNCFYYDLITELDSAQTGIRIHNINYNVFCYADDVMIASLTQSGLQHLTNLAASYIESLGLRFNPTKSSWCVFGTPALKTVAPLTMGGEEIRMTDGSIDYLGVTIGGRADASHASKRASACRRAFFALQRVGLHRGGLAPEVIRHLWMAALRPVLLYGSHCIRLPKSSLELLQRTQGQLLKISLGVKKWCHHSPLLSALDVPTAEHSITSAERRTLWNSMRGPSRAAHFHSRALASVICGQPVDPSGLVARLCAKTNHSIVECLMAGRNCKTCTRERDPHEPDGIEDTVRQLLSYYCDENCAFINMLLNYAH
jgi:exonuclease III